MEETKGIIKEQLGFQSQFNCNVKGHLTEFVVHSFTNKCVILVTQYGGLPNLYTVQFDINNERDRRISPLVKAKIIYERYFITLLKFRTYPNYTRRCPRL